MAVIDRGFNGYRDLILPLAEYDSLVQKAVVVAATEHLSSKLARHVLPNPNAYNGVLCGLRLRSQTMVPYKDDISMTTLLLLLLCEMISGGDKFTQIYGIMRGLIRSAGVQLEFSPSRLGRFVEIQTLRVQLIAESLFNEAEGSNFVHVQLEKCLEFLRYCQSFHPEHSVLMSLLFDVMTQACRLYVLRASTDPPLCDTVQLVEDFKQVAEKVAVLRGRGRKFHDPPPQVFLPEDAGHVSDDKMREYVEGHASAEQDLGSPVHHSLDQPVRRARPGFHYVAEQGTIT
ncbi:hypothetical protein PV11_01606 [Exophiala sideris]|uniref:Uncharacterized protein n=1 Tax=Exophiala sideris TaxID=1016849 RepID=A0A0D1ZGN6_9EURO|nr:hypothetical protein PV11_01606 [Exophiala sideris]